MPAEQYFRECCLRDEPAAQAILDRIFDSSPSLPAGIKSYIAERESLDEFRGDGDVCGLVYTSNMVIYRCRTCAIHPCSSLCADCFESGDHRGHEVDLIRTANAGLCDCGDGSVMHAGGFCSRHGPRRIPYRPLSKQLLQRPRLILPRLIVRMHKIAACAAELTSRVHLASWFSCAPPVVNDIEHSACPCGLLSTSSWSTRRHW